MKHIKRFNESNNILYHEISQEEFGRAYGINMSTSDISNITNDFKKNYNYVRDRDYGQNQVDGSDFSALKIYNIGSKYVLLEIFIGEDEWFYVHIKHLIYYKCDQLDGLLQLLKDKGFLNLI